MATALQPGALTPSQTQQTGSKKAVSLIDSLLTQPSLPQGTSITPQVQNVQTNELLTTPGVTGTVAAQSTAATAPTAMPSIHLPVYRFCPQRPRRPLPAFHSQPHSCG